MIKVYKITGMTCGHCVHTVKKTLESIEGVDSAEVTLEPPLAKVNMCQSISESALNEILATKGHYHLITA